MKVKAKEIQCIWWFCTFKDNSHIAVHHNRPNWLHWIIKITGPCKLLYSCPWEAFSYYFLISVYLSYTVKSFSLQRSRTRWNCKHLPLLFPELPLLCESFLSFPSVLSLPFYVHTFFCAQQFSWPKKIKRKLFINFIMIKYSPLSHC